MHHADITGNGLNDIIVCYQYGMTMVDSDPTGGKIIWLENPGLPGATGWLVPSAGRHRIRIGLFTRTDKRPVLALPIVVEPHDLHSITPLMLFTAPDDVHAAGGVAPRGAAPGERGHAC